MIEDEVLEIVNDTEDQGVNLDYVVDQFREGRDADELRSLLCSDNDELVQIGAWITSELSFDRYNTSFFIDKLRELTDHQSSAIRFCALSAIYPSLDPTQQETRDLIAKLLNDTNEGVRLCAEAAASNLGIGCSQFAQRQDDAHFGSTSKTEQKGDAAH